MKDPAVGRCAASTRGIWMDLLCAMHENERSGEVSGTLEQLARMSRCTVDEMRLAVSELEFTSAAEMVRNGRSRGSHGTITVRNRRMYRAAQERLAARERQEKHRERLESRESHSPVTDEKVLPSSSSSPSGDTDNPSPTPSLKGKGRRPKRITRRDREALGAFAGMVPVSDRFELLRDTRDLLAKALAGEALNGEESYRLEQQLAAFGQPWSEAGLAWCNERLDGGEY